MFLDMNPLNIVLFRINNVNIWWILYNISILKTSCNYSDSLCKKIISYNFNTAQVRVQHWNKRHFKMGINQIEMWWHCFIRVFALMGQPQSAAAGRNGWEQLKGNFHWRPYFILISTMMVWANRGRLQVACKIYYAQWNSDRPPLKRGQRKTSNVIIMGFRKVLCINCKSWVMTHQRKSHN